MKTKNRLILALIGVPSAIFALASASIGVNTSSIVPTKVTAKSRF